jgi:hypothetical protein
MGSQIHFSQYFTTLEFRGFGVIIPLFSRSGQRRTNHGLDPMVREAPKYPWIYDSRYFTTGKWARV